MEPTSGLALYAVHKLTRLYGRDAVRESAPGALFSPAIDIEKVRSTGSLSEAGNARLDKAVVTEGPLQGAPLVFKIQPEFEVILTHLTKVSYLNDKRTVDVDALHTDAGLLQQTLEKVGQACQGREMTAALLAGAIEVGREIRTAFALRPHPHIVETHAAVSVDFHAAGAVRIPGGGEWPRQLLVGSLQEFCDGGSLHTFISDLGVFCASRPGVQRSPEFGRLMGTIAQQLASGLAHMHRRGLIHGDLKLGNAVIKTTSCIGQSALIKICDFGTSHPINPNTGGADVDPYCTGTLGMIDGVFLASCQPADCPSRRLHYYPHNDVASYGLMLGAALLLNTEAVLPDGLQQQLEGMAGEDASQDGGSAFDVFVQAMRQDPYSAAKELQAQLELLLPEPSCSAAGGSNGDAFTIPPSLLFLKHLVLICVGEVALRPNMQQVEEQLAQMFNGAWGMLAASAIHEAQRVQLQPQQGLDTKRYQMLQVINDAEKALAAAKEGVRVAAQRCIHGKAGRGSKRLRGALVAANRCKAMQLHLQAQSVLATARQKVQRLDAKMHALEWHMRQASEVLLLAERHAAMQRVSALQQHCSSIVLQAAALSRELICTQGVHRASACEAGRLRACLHAMGPAGAAAAASVEQWVPLPTRIIPAAGCAAAAAPSAVSKPCTHPMLLHLMQPSSHQQAQAACMLAEELASLCTTHISRGNCLVVKASAEASQGCGTEAEQQEPAANAARIAAEPAVAVVSVTPRRREDGPAAAHKERGDITSEAPTSSDLSSVVQASIGSCRPPAGGLGLLLLMEDSCNSSSQVVWHHERAMHASQPCAHEQQHTGGHCDSQCDAWVSGVQQATVTNGKEGRDGWLTGYVPHALRNAVSAVWQQGWQTVMPGGKVPKQVSRDAGVEAVGVQQLERWSTAGVQRVLFVESPIHGQAERRQRQMLRCLSVS